MIFTELRFLAFFGLVFFVFWSQRGNTTRKVWLLAASYLFYAAWDWRFLSLILVSTIVDYLVGCGLGISRSPTTRRALLITSLTVNLGLLGVFKYFDFFVDSAAHLLEWLGFHASLPVLHVVLPVGISFYTFQTLSYSIDVYRGELEPTRNLLDLSLFVAFFPQLVAGPIVRASAFLPQLHRPTRLSAVRFQPNLVLFLSGFVKKACISDNIAPVVDAYFADPGSYTAHSAWIAVCLYAIQIYCDFSGYSDMAIACAAMLGYDLGPNFRYPYLASDIRDFWRRWHISLSTWLRDYLYIPLGGNRGGPWFRFRNLMLTMLLGGLWHGAAWHFVFWGFLHGLALGVHRVWSERFAPRGSGWRLLSWAATLYWVLFAWIFFRAQDLDSALTTARSFVLLSSDGLARIDPAWWLLIAAFGGAHLLASRLGLEEGFVSIRPYRFAAAYGVIWCLVLLFVQIDVLPFIYFQF